MQPTYGYAGKQLRVSLGTKTIREEPLNPEVLREYLGGVGYGARLLYSELEKGIDPLGPDNKLIFATGPLTGNNMPGGGSVELCFKSPLTGGWGESRCGGDFGPDLKRAGYDFVIIEGKAEEPTHLLITDEGIQFRPAGHLSGKTVGEKTRIIREELNDPKLSVMCIGPGGESLVLYATVMSDDRAAGRCGAGAVMGSKNLLAVAAKGSQKVEIADNKKFMAAVRAAMKVVMEHPNCQGFKSDGTTGDIPGCDAVGDWPTKNWHSNSWGMGEEIYRYFKENNLVTNNECYRGCPVGCGRMCKVDDGKFKTPLHEGAEYETLSAFTAFVLNRDVDAAINATYWCNQLGIDTISSGSVIAFAMECFEHGIITLEDTGGLDLAWGNPEALPALVKMIANRKGIGDILAEGTRRAAGRLGPRAKEFAMHGKGLEVPAHDPRSGKALGITYATGNRGACHIHPLEGMAYDCGKADWGLVPYGVPDPETIDRWDEIGKGKLVKFLQDAMIVPDIVCNCKFMMYCGLTLDHMAAILEGLTGWNISVPEMIRVGERVYNIQRLFNLREGFSPKDDQIPKRIRSIPAFGAYSQEERCAFTKWDEVLAEYYQARDWEPETGMPSDSKLKELGLDTLTV